MRLPVATDHACSGWRKHRSVWATPTRPSAASNLVVCTRGSESADAKEQQCSLNETALKDREAELQRVNGLIEVEREQQALLIMHMTRALDEQV